MQEISISVFRNNAAEVLRSLLRYPDEVYLLTQHDRPRAIVMSPEEYVKMGGKAEWEGSDEL
jgi:PHD/YefM family antitoxin component YafN of YafNO toxin-antitoxin module